MRLRIVCINPKRVTLILSYTRSHLGLQRNLASVDISYPLIINYE